MSKYLITPEEIGSLARPTYAEDEIVIRLIEESQREDLKPRIGDALYMALIAYEPSAGEEPRLSLLLDGGRWSGKDGAARYLTGLKTALAYFVYARIVRDGNIQSTRYGAVIKSDDNSRESEMTERQRHYRQSFASADALLLEVLSFLSANADMFPEYASGRPFKSNRTRFNIVGDDNCRASAPRDKMQVTVLRGLDGLSAYEIAVINGFRGTEEQWLESLRGKDGSPLTWEDLTDEQKEELKGKPGDKGDSGNINFPRFRVDGGMHLVVSDVSESDEDRFRIDSDGHLQVRY